MKPIQPQTLLDKLWESHVVYREKGTPDILYIDLHLLYEVTSPQAFEGLRERKLKVRRTDKTFATIDHNVSTTDQHNIRDLLSRHQIQTLEKNAKEFGITLFGLQSPHQGIVHVIGPELGLVQPGMSVVCGDSHTSTNGALGALSWGIGTSEVEMVLATQCILAEKPKFMKITVNGILPKGVYAKDIILTIIKKLGANGCSGYAVEYDGEAIRNLPMEGRFTICNMSIEMGARMGMVGVDDKTIAYLKNKKYAPKGKNFHKQAQIWKTFVSDKQAKFDKTVAISANDLEPMVTYGTNPSMAIKISDSIPHPSDFTTSQDRETFVKALAYMNLKPGISLEGFPIDMVFIGSCTNSRFSDLKEAALMVKGKKVRPNVIALVVPGSRSVKVQAEKEGIDKIFKKAGFQWRFAGCSACCGLNDDKVPPGNYCASTSNRNFEGRQGPGARTFLVSPAMAAAAAVEGAIVDIRKIDLSTN